MVDRTNAGTRRTFVRTDEEAIERLVSAWLRWEASPSSHHAVVEKEAALTALGLAGCEAHEYIAAARRSGFDVPSAAVRAVNDLGSRCAG